MVLRINEISQCSTLEKIHLPFDNDAIFFLLILRLTRALSVAPNTYLLINLFVCVGTHIVIYTLYL